MEDIRELLASRIEAVHDPVQKILLQDVLADVFGELVKYSDDRYGKLERKIDQELIDPVGKYYIVTGACKRESLDEASRCLFEIPIESKPKNGILGAIFLACDYPMVRQCMEGLYPARVETKDGSYRTTAALRFCNAYREKISWLYRQFTLNQREWHTVNCPFLYKLLDIIDTEGKVPPDAQIEKVELSLGKFSEFVVNNVVLVWNLKESIQKASIEAVAAGKEAVQEHRISLSELPDARAGYLAAPEGEADFNVVFHDDAIFIRTQKERYPNFPMLRIAPIDLNKDHTKLLYPLQTNQRKMRHADRQALKQPRFLLTRGEVERILTSYEVFEEFELLDICVSTRPGLACSYFNGIKIPDCNFFIRAHSFLKEKPMITLILHSKNEKDIFRYEKLFFLVSELQLLTDEYQWGGRLGE